MKLTYGQFNEELERLADKMLDLTQNVEITGDISNEMVRDNARMHILDLVESLESEFGTVLDD